jgi:hypothetical protein
MMSSLKWGLSGVHPNFLSGIQWYLDIRGLVFLPRFPAKKAAGFRASSVVKVKSSFSSKIALYFRILESVGHLPAFWFRIAQTWQGMLMI